MAVRKKETVKKTAEPEFCVYLGPSIIGVIQTGTVLPGTKAESIESVRGAVERYPLIASLIVSGVSLPEAKIKVRTPGNLLYVNYHKLLSGKS